jgi:hypothetical protein
MGGQPSRNTRRTKNSRTAFTGLPVQAPVWLSEKHGAAQRATDLLDNKTSHSGFATRNIVSQRFALPRFAGTSRVAPDERGREGQKKPRKKRRRSFPTPSKAALRSSDWLVREHLRAPEG